MKKVWMVADTIISPLGINTRENFENIRKGISGLRLISNEALSPEPFFGGLIDNVSEDAHNSKFEVLCQQVLQQLAAQVSLDPDRTIFLLSTTKGNISFLEQGQHTHPRIDLHATAAYLADMFGFKHKTVICNACISGVMAMLVGKRMIERGTYDHAVIVGADVLSRFVISGFQSLQALSSEMCRPFDEQRKGINLGECAAGVVLSAHENFMGGKSSTWIAGGGLSNDANHISGPSRTGEELGSAIQQAFDEAKVGADDIDFVSAHGTATLYNDEMEAKAFNFTKLNRVPLNSLKGYYGHTLGAAGVLETILCSESLKQDELVPAAGFEHIGVSQSVNVISNLSHQPLKTCLKTASGFGGCNAAIILKKENKFES